MPLFKGVSSKATPKAAIRYITRDDKAAYVSVRNLFEDEDYAKQFEETAGRFKKGKKYDERKYYHFKLSCARKDDVDAQEAHIYAEELAAKLFPDCECVIATHTDTQTIHSHIIVNAVQPLTGKKLHITDREYTKMKDKANEIGKFFGFTETDFRKKAKDNRTQEEKHLMLKGGTSWKEELREVIEEAKQVSATEEEFIGHLKLYGVTLTRSKSEYSYLHPKKKKAIRGLKLGENYTKKEILNVIDKRTNGKTGNAACGAVEQIGRDETHDGESAVERSVGDIERELQELDRKAECAHRGVETGSQESKAGQREPDEKSAMEYGVREQTDEGSRKRGTAVQGGDKQNDKRNRYANSK